MAESCQLAERDLQTEQCRGTPQEPFARQLQTRFNFLWKRHQIAQDNTQKDPDDHRAHRSLHGHISHAVGTRCHKRDKP